MDTTLTFKDVCELIKKEHQSDPKLIEAVDSLLGVAFILSRIVFGPAGAAALALLGVKNELIKIGKSVYEKLTSKKDEDRSLGINGWRWRFASSAIRLSSIPWTIFSRIRKELSIKATYKLNLSEALRSTAARGNEGARNRGRHAGVEASVGTHPIRFPHPFGDFSEQTEQLGSLYAEMTKGVAKFVESVAPWEAADDENTQEGS